MSNAEALKNLEKILGISKKLPKRGKGEVEMEISLEKHQFKDSQTFEVLSRYIDDDSENIEELCVLVRGTPIWSRPGTLEDPPEGGYSEDVTVYFEGQDISELLTEEDFENIASKHYDYCEEV